MSLDDVAWLVIALVVGLAGTSYVLVSLILR